MNAVAAAYVQQNLDKRLQASRKATVWLRKEGDSLRDRIAEGERRIHTLKEDKRLVGNGNTQAADLQNLGALNLSYLEKRRERLALRAELDELRKFLTSPDLTQSAKYPTLLNNPRSVACARAIPICKFKRPNWARSLWINIPRWWPWLNRWRRCARR